MINDAYAVDGYWTMSLAIINIIVMSNNIVFSFQWDKPFNGNIGQMAWYNIEQTQKSFCKKSLLQLKIYQMYIFVIYIIIFDLFNKMLGTYNLIFG